MCACAFVRARHLLLLHFLSLDTTTGADIISGATSDLPEDAAHDFMFFVSIFFKKKLHLVSGATSNLPEDAAHNFT
jgi:hypothetical protein